ncbi:MAG: response regulator [Anaerolineae bacterium]|jgi:signal transduction histidine kinase|nr:response regulator [Anaerolineae bacterium]MDH7475257.1 response regulator [Anaerolineae bacterium]
MNEEGFHILIVEDEQDTAEYMSTLLEIRGYTTSWAYSGTEALEMLDRACRQEDGSHPIHLVILDVRLPDLDGYEVCRRIKNDEALKHVSVIMVTALHSTSDKTKGLDLGADDYITKPFQPEELLARVRAVLRVRQMEREARQRAIELEQSQAQLIQVEKLAAMGRLAASIAHELNNPLQAIQNCLHLVLKRPLPEPKRRQYLEMAQEEVERLIRIVQGMLEFYRPSKGQRAPIDTNTIVENVLTLAAKQLQHGQVTVHQRLAPNLPPLEAVSDQLKQVFLNIVINAVEAMPDGGDLYVDTGLTPDGRWITVSFTDTGIGLSPEEQANIFEPFYTTKTKGTGLGLSVSYGIIERHGGSIEVHSQPGQGSRFTVKLPVSQPDQPIIAPRERARQQMK